MQVFNLFFKIAKKRIISAAVYLMLFIILTIMMSANAKDNNEKNFTVSSLDICIIDRDNSTASKSLTNFLGTSHNIVDLKTEDRDILQDNLYYQNIDYILTIEKNFEQKLISGETQNLVSYSQLFDSISSHFAGQQINEYIDTMNLYLAGGFSLNDALSKTTSSLLNTSEITMIDFENKSVSSSDTIFYYFQYVPYVMLSMLIVGLAPILITFRKKDVKSRIDCSSLTLRSKNIQLTLGCIVYGLALWGLFIILGGFFSGFDILFSTNGILCIINSLLFLMVSIAITLLVSTITLSDNVLNMISNIIGLGMSFLCGIFVPQWLLGHTVISIARFLPAYWYIKVNNMISGFSGDKMSYSDYWIYIGIQGIFFVATMSIYFVASKQKKTRN